VSRQAADARASQRAGSAGTSDGQARLTGAGIAALPRASEGPLYTGYDAALLDLDGVIYTSQSAVPGAVSVLHAARDAGLPLAFVTNNASRSPSAIAAQLTGLGVAATAAEVVTSAQAAARLIASRIPAGSAVLVAGGTGLRLALREHGLRPVSTAADHPAAVVQGYAPDLSYSLLAEAALAIRAGAWFVASNGDATLPTARGLQPGNGSLVRAIETATGVHAEVAGKPEPPLHAEAITRTGARHPLVVGDRLDTDIAGAVRAGADSLLVLTGVTGPADAVLAPPQRRPVFLAADLGGLLDVHPAVTRDGAYFRCGGWTSRLTAGAGDGGDTSAAPAPVPEVTGAGNPLDGLRAVCAAAWSLPRPLSADAAVAAVAKVGLPAAGAPL
jgi:glycerol-1-phosphatase